jgi:hypothetical protein
MKRELMHCPLSFATAQAYDSTLRDPGSLWVHRSAETFIDAAHGHGAIAGTLADTAHAPERAFRRQNIGRDKFEAACANPLRDEPDPMVVRAVKRFGLVGLVTCAVGTGLLRWWHSLADRVH